MAGKVWFTPFFIQKCKLNMGLFMADKGLLVFQRISPSTNKLQHFCFCWYQGGQYNALHWCPCLEQLLQSRKLPKKFIVNSTLIILVFVLYICTLRWSINMIWQSDHPTLNELWHFMLWMSILIFLCPTIWSTYSYTTHWPLTINIKITKLHICE